MLRRVFIILLLLGRQQYFCRGGMTYIIPRSSSRPCGFTEDLKHGQHFPSIYRFVADKLLRVSKFVDVRGSVVPPESRCHRSSATHRTASQTQIHVRRCRRRCRCRRRTEGDSNFSNCLQKQQQQHFRNSPRRGNLLGNFRIRTVSLVSADPLPTVSRPFTPRVPNRKNTGTAFSIDIGTDTNAVESPRPVYVGPW